MMPLIIGIDAKKMLGMCLSTNMIDNKTVELWQRFMPRRKEIAHAISTDLFAIQVFDEAYDFGRYNPDALFDKWACVEVGSFDNIPEGFLPFELSGGLYAVFLHKGFEPSFEYIFGEWLPNNRHYELDNRPHFEILGEKYKRNDEHSEEEIWIPIKTK